MELLSNFNPELAEFCWYCWLLIITEDNRK